MRRGTCTPSTAATAADHTTYGIDGFDPNAPVEDWARTHRDDPAIIAALTRGTACVACGYSLEGLATHVCPECGKDNAGQALLPETTHTTSNGSDEEGFRTLTGFFAYSAALATVAWAGSQARQHNLPALPVIAWHAVVLSILTTWGLAAYAALSRVVPGFHPYWWWAAQRVAASATVLLALGLWLQLVPLGLGLQIAVWASALIALCLNMLELGWRPAVLLALACGPVWWLTIAYVRYP